MKTRILQNNLFGGVYTDEFLKKIMIILLTAHLLALGI